MNRQKKQILKRAQKICKKELKHRKNNEMKNFQRIMVLILIYNIMLSVCGLASSSIGLYSVVHFILEPIIIEDVAYLSLEDVLLFVALLVSMLISISLLVSAIGLTLKRRWATKYYPRQCMYCRY